MPTAKHLTIETVNLDDDREIDEFDRQVIAAGMERVRAEIKELQQKGLLDAQGKPVLREVPPPTCRRVPNATSVAKWPPHGCSSSPARQVPGSLLCSPSVDSRSGHSMLMIAPPN